jgi:hypothetical protein
MKLLLIVLAVGATLTGLYGAFGYLFTQDVTWGRINRQRMQALEDEIYRELPVGMSSDRALVYLATKCTKPPELLSENRYFCVVGRFPIAFLIDVNLRVTAQLDERQQVYDVKVTRSTTGL